MNRLEKTFKILKLVFIILIICTLGFIFINSMLPPEISSEQSGVIGDIIAEIIPPSTEAGSFIQQYLRKIAHFTEYGLLAIEMVLFAQIFYFIPKKGKASVLWALVLLTPFAVGFVDESIQMLNGRGPSILDVWIDIGGYYTFGALAYAVVFVSQLIFRIITKMLEKRAIQK